MKPSGSDVRLVVAQPTETGVTGAAGKPEGNAETEAVGGARPWPPPLGMILLHFKILGPHRRPIHQDLHLILPDRPSRRLGNVKFGGRRAVG